MAKFARRILRRKQAKDADKPQSDGPLLTKFAGLAHHTTREESKMRKLALVLFFGAVVATLATIPAGATTPGANGQIAFTRYDPDTEESHIFMANPDGTHQRELPLPFPADNAIWSPDGSRILVTPFRPDASFRPATVNPDGSGFTLLEVPELPTDVDMGCKAWSPDRATLLCQAIRFGGDTTLNGLYTIRAADGGGLTRLTTNPYPPSGDFGGGDIPGDYSPDGTQFVFTRVKPGGGPVPDRNQSGALFVENADGTNLHQITPYGLAASHEERVATHWSPDGSEILFAGARGTLFVVHPDGGGLRAIPLETGGSHSIAFTPDWSPDGTRIIFSLVLQSTGQEDIYTARPDGTDIGQATDTPDFENFADWGTHPVTP
jgi:Tol biopolymer transport system component